MTGATVWVLKIGFRFALIQNFQSEWLNKVIGLNREAK
jgi:hypothetical protein